MFTVIVTEKGGTQQRIEFDEEMISIGRVQGNQIVLPRGNVSKRHAKIELKGGEFVLTDMGSTNGTYVNGRRIQEPTRLTRGDKVYLGDFILSLEGHEALDLDEPDDAPKDLPKPAGPVPPAAIVSVPAKAAAPKDPRAGRPKARQAGALPQAAEGVVTSPIASVGEQLAAKAHPGAPPAEVPLLELPGSDSAIFALVETLLDRVAREVKRIDRSAAPSRVDEGTAGKVRITLEELVEDLASRGKIPSAAERGALLGKAFRAAVDLGPFSGWLEDPEVEAIRVLGPSEVALLKGGAWAEGSGGFPGEDDLLDALRCLGAGIEARDDGVTGLARYRLEEGHLVFSSVPPAASSASVLITKVPVHGPGPRGDGRLMAPEAWAAVRTALEAKSKIAVVGGSAATRLAVMRGVIRSVPEDEVMVAVEDLPLLGIEGRCRVGLFARNLATGVSRSEGFAALLRRALDLEPDWIAVGATPFADLPTILAAATGRPGIVAEIPLGAAGPLDREIAAVMAMAGAPLALPAAAGLLSAAFDLMVVLGRADSGGPLVSRILAPALDERGAFAPKVLYDRQGRS
ncbi:MAG: FHA domain-containing protein [Deltaproteobacteria bacterium]|nr:FHA domain-containing protein [Deltaproteobacteria bacterium]